MKHTLALLAFFAIFLLASAQNPHRDSTFSFDGHVATPVGPNNEAATSVVVQSDRRIIAGGTQTDHPIFGPQQFALVRYLEDGSIDSSFGTGGFVISSFLSQNYCNVIKLLADEKILAAGQANTGICIARYLNDGAIDSSFGANGFTSIFIGTNTAAINDIEILPGGKIIAAGTKTITGSVGFEPMLVRFDSLGIPDSSFGVNGFIYPPTGFSSVAIRKILVQPDGKFLIGGSCEFDPGGGVIEQMLLFRCDSAGSIDSTFGVNGIATYPSSLNVNDMAFDNNGNIVAVGEIGTNDQGTAGDAVVLRFLPDGSEDLSFGTSGSTSISADSYAEYANAILIDADGGILLGGSFFNFAGGSGTDCMVVRFTANGQPDSTFGTNGIFKTGVSSGTDMIQDMAMTPDHKIVVSGSGNYGANFDFVVGRIISDVTTSISSVTAVQEISIFPNPAQDLLTVSTVGQHIVAEIFSMQGRKIICPSIMRDNHLEISVTDLPAGIYFIQISGLTENRTMKFIKL